MSHYFHLGQERAQWVASGFMVADDRLHAHHALVLARYGYRRTYTGTMWLLLIGGIVGGVSSDFNLCWPPAWPKAWRPAWCSPSPPSSSCAPSTP